MPSLCAGMPLITMHYAPIIKRRETLKSMTHRARHQASPEPGELVEEEHLVDSEVDEPTPAPAVLTAARRPPNSDSSDSSDDSDSQDMFGGGDGF